ncbi:baseplate J/gp47 family protein [Teredinibacter purpureus]|uniref:baseplate J/gp47 family protein n=1 Tax=Teredinibacter purpureus TaxID=2731756 RepID=UPI0005F7972F|nr:baseplate J/gp47 family protein [Teredinibacter purpureus]
MKIEHSDDGRKIDYTARDYESLLLAMQKMAPEKLPEWTDYSQETDFGHVLLQLFAHMGDIVAYHQDRLVNESFLSTARERASIIDHLKLVGYRLSTAAPSSTELTVEFSADTTARVRLSSGDAFATKSSKGNPSVRFEYSGENDDIDCALLAVDPISNKKTVRIPVEQGQLIKTDVVGNSNGLSGQRFALNFTDLILRDNSGNNNRIADITVWTELGGVMDNSWRLQESLAFSREDAQDYVIEIDENEQAFLIFGGNGFGAVPTSGSTIRARYRVGGGALGNVAAHQITTLSDAPGLSLVAAKVTNKTAATGGADRETIEHAIEHAPGMYRSFRRAVTADDYKQLAENYNGVGKVRAEATHWNRVTLYVAPEGGGRVSDILSANLLSYFDSLRPVSTLIEVADVDYVKIYISARIGVESYYARAEIRLKVEEAITSLLAFHNVDFGQVLFLSKFYEAIEKIDGVAYVTIDEFSREGHAGTDDSAGRLQLLASEVPRIPGSSVEDTEHDAHYRNGVKLTALEGGF